MKPAPFAYARPDTVEEALEVLAEHGPDARVLAGGQSLAAMLNMRLVRPRVLVDISALAALDTVALRGGAIEVGAAATQDRLARWPGLADQPLLGLALPWVGHWQTRQRGTVCGSLAHGDPSSELPLALAALGGEVVLRSRRGRRVVGAAAFQTGALRTDIRDDEAVVAARFPVAAPGTAAAFREVGPRHGDFAIVAAAAVADPDGATLAIGGVADTPAVRRLPRLADDALADALNEFAWELGGGTDMHATAEYRRALTRRLGAAVIREARDALDRG